MSASTIPFPLLTSHIGIYCPRNERHRNWRKYRSEATVGEFFDILRESFVCSASDRCFSAYVSLFHRALQAVIRRSHDAVGLICSPLSAFPDKSRSHCSLLIRFTRLAFQSISSISRLGRGCWMSNPLLVVVVKVGVHLLSLRRFRPFTNRFCGSSLIDHFPPQPDHPCISGIGSAFPYLNPTFAWVFLDVFTCVHLYLKALPPTHAGTKRRGRKGGKETSRTGQSDSQDGHQGGKRFGGDV